MSERNANAAPDFVFRVFGSRTHHLPESSSLVFLFSRKKTRSEKRFAVGISSLASFFILFLLLVFLNQAKNAGAQQIHVRTPMQKNGSSFSESIGSNWGVSGKNWFFNFGGPQSANLPRYGGFDMNSGLKTGFQFQRGGTHGYFNGWAGQGSSAYSSVETPSATFMNGQSVFMQDVTDTPFVVSHIPVVGGWHGNEYQPFYDPEVTLSPSILQQKLRQLEQEKALSRQIHDVRKEGQFDEPLDEPLDESVEGQADEQTAPKRSGARKAKAGKKGKKSSQTSADARSDSKSGKSKGSTRNVKGPNSDRTFREMNDSEEDFRSSRYASNSQSRNRNSAPNSAYSRRPNPHTAESPVPSVAEMKRRRAAQNAGK